MKKKSNEKSFRILIANGVNLDLLGRREPEVYGGMSLKEFASDLEDFAQDLNKAKTYQSFNLKFFQTNDESKMLEELSGNWDGCVLNPGAWTHTSLALADRLKGLSLCFVEVHISNTFVREPIRHESLTAPHSKGVIVGAGAASYRVGLVALLEAISRK